MMRRLLLLCCFLSPLYAAPVDWGDQETFPAPPPFYPFSIGGSYAYITPTKFYTPDVAGQEITYRQADANFAYTHPFSPICGMIFGAGWVGTDVDWAENPAFNETNFNYVNISFGGFTKAFDNWLWSLNLAAFLDTDHFSLANYALYQGLLWGKYTWKKCLELDFGFLLEVGLNKDKVWPVLGFIYNWNDKLRLHAVYPLDMTLEYDIFPILTAGGAIRIFRNRHRVGSNEPEPNAIFQYQTWGVEFDLKLKPAPWFLVNGFVGSAGRGDLKITNSSDKHGIHYKFRSSLYGGGYAALSF